MVMSRVVVQLPCRCHSCTVCMLLTAYCAEGDSVTQRVTDLHSPPLILKLYSLSDNSLLLLDIHMCARAHTHTHTHSEGKPISYNR